MAQHSTDVLSTECGNSPTFDPTAANLKITKVYLDPYAETVIYSSTNKWADLLSNIGGAMSLAYEITAKVFLGLVIITAYFRKNKKHKIKDDKVDDKVS